MSRAALVNWAGTHTFSAPRLRRPGSVEELQDVVAHADRIRALGTRHSFTDLADTDGDLVDVTGLPTEIDVDERAGTVRVSAGTSYGELARVLHASGRALASLASLPHISVGGAVATGTHGSGDRVGSLASAVVALDLVGATGECRTVARGDHDFAGHVVALGALGVVTHVTLEVEPSYDVRQQVYERVAWDDVLANFDEVTGTAYSVSLFTDWGPEVQQVWAKSRGELPPDVLGARPATRTRHMLADQPAEAVTTQLGEPGPWHERLPHFRLDHTPSAGEELQSEYLLPRARVPEAVAALRALAPSYAGLLQVAEIRTVAADDLWLSSSYDVDAVGLHFTWVRDLPGVYAVLPAVEAALLPLGARPHWGKAFVASYDVVRGLYPRLEDFLDLRRRLDPDDRFGNAFLDRVLGPVAPQRS